MKMKKYIIKTVNGEILAIYKDIVLAREFRDGYNSKVVEYNQSKKEKAYILEA